VVGAVERAALTRHVDALLTEAARLGVPLPALHDLLEERAP
jgi:hypothetical protein